jgi:hypothetical protein
MGRAFDAALCDVDFCRLLQTDGQYSYVLA